MHLCLLPLNLDVREEQGVDGEEEREDADGVDEDAVEEEELDQTPSLPHVQPIDIFLQ